MQKTTLHSSGFSLVELSIVLVILGLLTGGILGGQALIKAAELRAVTTEFSQWQTAINTFKGKYFALPGDMRNATQFWGNADTGGTGGDCGAPLTDAGSGTQTCNGDGNGEIKYSWKGAPPAQIYEIFRFWQHLSNAGLINGDFPGTGTSGSSAYATGRAPVSKSGNAYWGIIRLGGGMAGLWHENAFGLVNNMDSSSDYNSFGLGTHSTLDGFHGAPVGGFLTPEEAWNIDMKMDDGKPGQGKVWATIPASYPPRSAGDPLNCSDSTRMGWATAEYNLSASGTNCALLFPRAFN